MYGLGGGGGAGEGGKYFAKGFKVCTLLTLMFSCLAKTDLKSSDMWDPGILFWQNNILVSRGGCTGLEMQPVCNLLFGSLFRPRKICEKGNFTHIFQLNTELPKLLCSTFLWVTLPTHADRLRQ